MRPLQKLGLTLFCGLWLPIALIPAWREVARAQFQGRMRYDTPGTLDQAAWGRFFIDAVPPVPAPKLSLLDVEKSRLELDAQLLAVQASADEMPRDRPAPGPIYAEVALPSATTRRAVNAAYDALLVRFDSEFSAKKLLPPLLAARLRWTLASLKNGRTETDPLGWSIPPRPAPRSWSLNFTSTELKRAVRLARRGAALEPDNAFWPWARCALHWAQRRDAEALQALHEAAEKSRFQDYQAAFAGAAVRQLETRHALLPTEKVIVTGWAARAEYRTRLMHAASLAAWRAIAAENGGQHMLAVQIYADIGRAGAVLNAQGSLWGGGDFTGLWMQNLAYAGAVRAPTGADRRTQSVMVQNGRGEAFFPLRLAANRFANYAQQQGRADLARLAQRDSLHTKRRMQQWSEKSQRQFVPGWSFAANGRWLAFYWLADILRLQIVLAAACWLLLGAVLGRRAKLDESAAPLRSSDVISALCAALLAFVAVALGLMAGAGWWRGGAQLELQTLMDAWPLAWQIGLLTAAPLLVCGAFLGILNLQRRRATPPEEKLRGFSAPLSYAISAFCAVVLLALVPSTEWQEGGAAGWALWGAPAALWWLLNWRKMGWPRVGRALLPFAVHWRAAAGAWCVLGSAAYVLTLIQLARGTAAFNAAFAAMIGR